MPEACFQHDANSGMTPFGASSGVLVAAVAGGLLAAVG
jgi:hypothetical protein